MKNSSNYISVKYLFILIVFLSPSFVFGDPIHRFAKNGNIEALTKELNSGVDPNIRDKLGYTAMHWAAYGGQVKVMETLASFKAELSPKNSTGIIPLHWAVDQKNMEAINFFLEKGVSPIIKDNKGRNSFDRVKFHNKEKIIIKMFEKFLLRVLNCERTFYY